MQFSSISHRVFFWLLAISLLPLAVMSELFLSEFKIKVVEIELKHLSQMADKKIEQINTYINERTADIETLSGSPLVYSAMIDIGKIFYKNKVNSVEYKQADEKIRNYLTNYLELGYYDLFLISLAGDIVFSVTHESDFATNLFNGPYQSTGLAETTRDALAVLETSVSEFDFYQPSNEPAAFISTPIIYKGKLLGVLALQIDINKVFDVVANNVGLGYTGETVIARKIGDSIYFVEPLKFKNKNKAEQEVVFGSALFIPMQQALNGESGKNYSIDSRGEEVIAVWRYLPVLHWGVVVKKDASEVLAVVKYMNDLRRFVFLILLIVILGAAYLIGRSIVRPIRNLTGASRKIAESDIYSYVEVEGVDEVGDLATAFNQMSKRLEEKHIELQNKVEEAERANQAKSDFLSRMSHELRTPLNAILGFGQVLLYDNAKFTETQTDNVNEILSAGYHLLELINEILDLAKIESGKIDMSIGSVDLDELVNQCIPIIENMAESRNIEIEDHISGKALKVEADATRLKQVLLNLLSNAVKYNRANGKIILDSDVVANGYLRIRITDSGNGLTEDMIEKLFSPFERLDKESSIEGTGIGLVISKHLIEMMGGTIGVESKRGKGCTFWFDIKMI